MGILLYFSPASAQALSDGEYKVNADSLNVRSSPNLDAPVIGSLAKGTIVSVEEEKYGWSKIDYNGKSGWVAGYYLVAASSSSPLKGKHITLDPGHGGYDPGAVGVNGNYEKDVNLKTAHATSTRLQAAGAEVTMTRDSDVYLPLENRVAVSHSSDSDAFISFHYNASTSSDVKGIGSYYYKEADALLAQQIQNELASQTDRQNDGVRYGDFHVLRENKKPSALLELGFLSNPEEGALVETDAYQNQVSEAVTNGIINYFSN
ncbi:N-acetylmuramoyl-L-alanine amidase [Halobacillus massiliensis]|uniref:N-acetylmuramoyl-L-alanine amidase n=1 Tax=Halobacillus massiliensis TaxID=1926286 RepID=UPI0015C4B540|nr:N-acetylmuramoyl-L-alanine amidase [Halobacillus massiliensis]